MKTNSILILLQVICIFWNFDVTDSSCASEAEHEFPYLTAFVRL